MIQLGNLDYHLDKVVDSLSKSKISFFYTR